MTWYNKKKKRYLLFRLINTTLTDFAIIKSDMRFNTGISSRRTGLHLMNDLGHTLTTVAERHAALHAVMGAVTELQTHAWTVTWSLPHEGKTCFLPPSLNHRPTSRCLPLFFDLCFPPPVEKH